MLGSKGLSLKLALESGATCIEDPIPVGILKSTKVLENISSSIRL